LIRLWTDLAPQALWSFTGQGLAVFGAVSAAIGTIGAYRAERLKPMIAYSTVAQIGYMVLALGVAAAEPRALAAVIAFVAAHAVAKSALFLAAGQMVKANGHDEIARLADPGPDWGPMRGAVAIAAATLIGLPPTGGFAAKWTLAQSGMAGGLWWVPLVLVLGGLATAGYMTRLAAALMRRAPDTRGVDAWSPEMQSEGARDAAAPKPVADGGWASLGLAMLALALGFASLPIAALMESGA
ncbi:MAG: proton-conducting transporter membrane subunit, partial [Pseudomonadota bacterium]